MPFQLSAIVVGAGIGGLAAAVALRQAGHKVTIVEKRAGKREVGFAVSVTPNASKLLRTLGVDFEAARMVHCAEDAILRAPRTQWPPEVLIRLPLHDLEKQYGGALMTVHRADLHDSLRELCLREGEGPPAVLLEGTPVVEFHSTGSIALQNGEILHADLIVAADGVKSTAHVQVVGDGQERPATPTGVSNVRFCVPSASIEEEKELKTFLELAPDGMSVTLGDEKDRLILRYPCRNKTMQNIGLYSEYASVTDRVAAEQRWKTQTKKAVALERMQGFHPCLNRLLDLSPEEEMYLWNVAERDPLPSFHRDRMIVLGDAAHPMLPTLGNGAGMAIEDAAALGVALRDVVTGDEVPTRLQAWDAVRRARASATQLLSRTMSVDYKLSKETQAMVRDFVSEKQLPEFTRACVNKWLFGGDCLSDMRRALGQNDQDWKPV